MTGRATRTWMMWPPCCGRCRCSNASASVNCGRWPVAVTSCATGRGEPIVRAGFSGEGFFAIAGGRARVQRSDGHEVILAQGDFFGDLSLIDGESRNATVVAETDLIALKLTRQSSSTCWTPSRRCAARWSSRWSSESARSKRDCPPDTARALHSPEHAPSLQVQPRFTIAAARAPMVPGGRKHCPICDPGGQPVQDSRPRRPPRERPAGLPKRAGGHRARTRQAPTRRAIRKA